MPRLDAYIDDILRFLVHTGKLSQLDAEDFKKLIQKTKEEGQDVTPLTLLKSEFGLTDKEILEVIADEFGYDVITRGDIEQKYRDDPSSFLLTQFDRKFAESYGVIPIEIMEKQLGGGRTVRILRAAVVDPWNVETEDFLQRQFPVDDVQILLISEDDFNYILQMIYGSRIDADADMLEVVEEEQTTSSEEDLEGPAVEFVKNVIDMAILKRASDIHIEPLRDSMRVRLRVDGVLENFIEAPGAKGLLNAVINRIKVLAKMDIAEKRKPQDGRFTVQDKAGRNVDIRVSTVPTVYGEKAVLRLLFKDPSLLKLERLGFEKDNLELFRQLIFQPYGMILVSGPTGSGKSTTLYAALNAIIAKRGIQINIMTIEDPVEYEMPGVNQVQVNPQAGLTFSTALRAFLRQDPDVILVGEIRDKETAEIAMHAALTGHLVLSTIHTNDAFSAPMRLVEMGIEPYLIASSLIGVVAQRLVRRLCQPCKTQVSPPPMPVALQESEKALIESGVLEKMGLEPTYWDVKPDCQECGGAKYRGRTAIHEIMKVDDDIRRLILGKAPSSEIKSVVLSKGGRTLLQDGLLKVYRGDTTVEELVKVVSSLEV